jgi:hypothetical protein
MTNRDFYVERRRAEVPVFLKVLKALPADRLSYKPHDRCPSAEQLVWTLASELRAGVDVVTQNEAEWRSEPPPPLDQMLELFERWSDELTDLNGRCILEPNGTVLLQREDSVRTTCEPVPLGDSLRRHSSSGPALGLPAADGQHRTLHLQTLSRQPTDLVRFFART